MSKPPSRLDVFGKLPKPYYDDGKGIVIYHGDLLEILPKLAKVDLELTDPPYGIGRSVSAKGAKAFRGNASGNKRIQRRDFNDKWDDLAPLKSTFDLIIQSAKFSIIFGGNYFELPISKKWLAWDKMNTFPTFSDLELAWTNLKGCSVKKFCLNGNGLMSKEKFREHPTQKPVDLMRWCIGFVPDCKTIRDSFMGSGTTLRAAKDLGKKCVGIELEEKYCEIAARRLQQEILL